MKTLGVILFLCIGLALQGGRPAYLPDPKLTPGAVDPKLTKDVICAAGWSTKSVRHTSGKLKATIYREYGIKTHTAGQYEVDHLISLEIGGADTRPNLWPESYTGPWNAHDKDRLENALHREVCSDVISLADAQKAISTDWTVAYKARWGEPDSVKQ
jgi:hypothetical protein